MKARIILILGIVLVTVFTNAYSQVQTNGNPKAKIGEQEEAIVFDFTPGGKMLYAQLQSADNMAKLRQFSKMISDNLQDIYDGKLVVRVNGYCTSFNTTRENLRAAKLRSNQVKSWFITHSRLKEEHFLTFNSALPWKGRGDVVAVAYLEVVGEDNSRIPVVVSDNRNDKQEIPPVVKNENENDNNIINEPPVVEENDPSPAINTGEPLAGVNNHLDLERPFSPRFAVKTNLLYWAGVMPDFKHYTFVPNLELEWFITNRWSLAATGAYIKREVGDNHFFGISSWSIEPRFWFNNNGRFNGFYAGIYGHAGDFDRQGYDGNEFGNTGDFYGGGISLGGVIPLGKYWGIEIGLRAGARYQETDVYTQEPPDYYLDFTRTETKWGIQGIKCSVVYRFGNKLR